MKKRFSILTSCVVLFFCLAFALSVFLSTAPKDNERFGWRTDGWTASSDSFNYSRREMVFDISIGNSFPALFLDNIDERNSCGPSTASNLVQYYDGIYPELIPNSNPMWGNTYTKTSLGAESVAEELYRLMKTNVGSAGTLLSDYKAGLKTYVERQGLKISYESSMHSFLFGLFKSFDLVSYTSYIKQNKPVSLVVQNIQYIEENSFVDSNGEVKLSIQNLGPMHILIGYGYVKYNYYRYETVSEWSPVWYYPLRFVKVTKEVKFRTDEYLKVSFGDGTLGYLNLNGSTIADAFISHITR